MNIQTLKKTLTVNEFDKRIGSMTIHSIGSEPRTVLYDRESMFFKTISDLSIIIVQKDDELIYRFEKRAKLIRKCLKRYKKTGDRFYIDMIISSGIIKK